MGQKPLLDRGDSEVDALWEWSVGLGAAEGVARRGIPVRRDSAELARIMLLIPRALQP